MSPASRDPVDDRAAWRRFGRDLIVGLILIMSSCYGFILALDPYGTRTGPDRRPTPIMDLNQRYMYPQLARSGLFDSAIFGTSTIRLVDPARLSALFDARVANLGLNAGTPWEQSQLATLFLRHVPTPKLLVFGLDRNWCEPDAGQPQKRVTSRSFPPWRYDEDPLNDLPEQMNLRSLEIAMRVALTRSGLMRERIRGDGYEVFTPSEGRYDLRQARTHIWSGTEESPAVAPGGTEGLRFPALDWLDALLARVPESSRTILILPPVHVAAQARPGSSAEAADQECKTRIAALSRRHGAVTVDYRFPSILTRDDSNYWDKLHYRLGIAERLADDLGQVARSGQAAEDGRYRVLSP